MSSKKLLKLAHKIVQKDKLFFDKLLELEKLENKVTKTRLDFTIDKSVASQFRKFCREKSYNMSAKIEQAMKEMMKEK